MSMPREVFEKYATEVQSNILSSSKQLAQARGSLNAHLKNQKVSALTLKELESMSSDTRVYRSIGKMFLQDSLPLMQKELSEKIEDSGKQAQVLQVAVAKFDKELKDSQKSLQELIKKVTAAA